MKLAKVKGSIGSYLGRLLESEQMGKFVQLSVVFYILKRGHPMTDYPSMSTLLNFWKFVTIPIVTGHWKMDGNGQSIFLRLKKKM